MSLDYYTDCKHADTRRSLDESLPKWLISVTQWTMNGTGFSVLSLTEKVLRLAG